MRFIRSNAIALVALFVALGGTATASSLITSRTIKDGTIQARDLSKTLRAQINAHSVPVQGPSGPRGATGATGAGPTPAPQGPREPPERPVLRATLERPAQTARMDGTAS